MLELVKTMPAAMKLSATMCKYSPSKLITFGSFETANKCVHDQDVNEEKNKLGACRHADAQHLTPSPKLRPHRCQPESEILIFFLEIENEQNVGDEDGDETGERRAGHAETR